MGQSVMIPENRLSTTPVPDEIIGARSLPVTPTQDFEDGGIALSDPSEGLMYQVWRATVSQLKYVYFDADNADMTLVYTGDYITEISFTFDQNMRPVLAFVEDGLPFFRWYDSTVEAQVVTALDKNVINPRVFLDDKRLLERGKSDIILGYIRSGSLYFRMQRDRFGVEYLLKEGVYNLYKIGMNKQLRVQFVINP